MHIVLAEDDLALLRALTRHFEAAGRNTACRQDSQGGNAPSLQNDNAALEEE